MRKELYMMICERLKSIEDVEIKHIDLWNNNVDYIEQEDGWERPAVFVEFMPLNWEVLKGGEYRSVAEVRLHVVTDWAGSAADGSELQAESLAMLDLSKKIHQVLCGMSGESFRRFDLKQTVTNHNHEEIVENVEVYGCVAMRVL